MKKRMCGLFMLLALFISVQQSYGETVTLSPTYGGTVSAISGSVATGDYQTANYGTANADFVAVMKYSMATVNSYVTSATLTFSVNYTVPVPFGTHYFVLEHYVGGNSAALAQADATTTNVERVPTILLTISNSNAVKLDGNVVKSTWPDAQFSWNVASYVAADKAAGYACSSFRIVETDANGNYASYGSDNMNGMNFVSVSLTVNSNTAIALSPTYGGSVSSSSGTIYSDYMTCNWDVLDMDAVSVMKYSLASVTRVATASLAIHVAYALPTDGTNFRPHYFVMEHYVGGNSTALAQTDATTTSVERVPNSLLTIHLDASWISVSKVGDNIVRVGFPCADFAWDVQSYVAADKAAGYGCSSFRIIETDADGNYVTHDEQQDGMLFGTPSLTISPVMAPEFAPGGSNISASGKVKISCGTEDASIYYTTDGTTPCAANGTLYTGPVTLGSSCTLKAIAVTSDGNASIVTSKAYTVPTSYNQPTVIPAGSATVDGDLSDWSGVTWASLNTTYDITNSSQEALDADIDQAYYAARWQAGKIYVAVKVKDMAHFFTDEYTFWNARDAVEIYLHTDGGDPSNYANATSAQQYIIGIMDSDHTKAWACISGAGTPCDPEDYPFDSIGNAAVKVDGDWLYYEVEIKPFTYLSYIAENSMTNSVVTDLFKGNVIGLDVCVNGHDLSAYSGTKSENSMLAKYSDWNLFGLHVLDINDGDANYDGVVDVGDLGILAANYGGTNKTWAQGDFNGDGVVDVGDLGILAANYGKGSSSGADFDADYAKVFGSTAESTASDDSTDDDSDSSICSSLGLSLITGLALMGLMIVRLEE
jgi:hypothetical protein